VPPADPFGLVGQVLDGHFRVERCVGEGGFSIVYKGTHVGLSEPIAIKCLKLPQALGSALVESFIKRFRDESRLHYRLSQGNLHIARSIASGTTVAPTTSALVPYTVLEWLDGRPLADEFDERRARGLRGRPLADLVKLLDSAIDALAYAHAQGVVHRDLNPGNLFLAKTPSGTKLKVLDFGVAKIMADSALAMGSAARTLGNMRIFTPAYGAPEQFDDRLGAIGPWTDVYAVALVVLEGLTDRTVMEGEHIGELATMALDAARRPTPRALGVPVGDRVQEVFGTAVAIAPDQRPRDAGEFWGMLKNAMAADKASGSLPHADLPRRSQPPSTLRMSEPVPEGSAAPVFEVARSGATSQSSPDHGIGGTLRMSGPQRAALLRPRPGSSPAASAAPVSSPDGPPDELPDAVPAQMGLTLGRASVLVVAVVLAILVLGALAAWLFSPKPHAAVHVADAGTHRHG
jgi:serine/threonine protein kinase